MILYFRQIGCYGFEDFGLIPELLGRFPIVTHLDKLDEATMLRILSEPKNSIINQFIELFRLDGVELSFTEGALQKIVKETMEKRSRSERIERNDRKSFGKIHV